MRIAFICSSLEPGRDGVGDYTRRLAGELIRQGQEVKIVSLNDKVEIRKQKAESGNQKSRDRSQRTEHKKGEIETAESGNGSRISGFRFQVSDFLEIQTSEGTEIECLRLPDSLDWQERATMARKWVDAFSPDWVSLQFVPFGFHPKGLPFGLPRHLKAIIGSRPLHWMFHELWVLWSFPLSLRKRLLGQLQKFWLILSLKKLKPQAVATQLPLYQVELKKIGVAAKVIPLHGNIPVYPKDEAKQWLSDRCTTFTGQKRLKAGFFGGILPTLNLSLFTKWTTGLNIPQNELLLLSAGKITGDGIALWNLLEQELNKSAKFFKLGELNEREVSLYFSALDYGLTSYPPELMGKSGSVAAMREHGLPVISCGSFARDLVSHTTNGCQFRWTEEPWTVKQSAHSILRQLQGKNL